MGCGYALLYQKESNYGLGMSARLCLRHCPRDGGVVWFGLATVVYAAYIKPWRAQKRSVPGLYFTQRDWRLPRI